MLYIRRNCFKRAIKPLIGDPRTHIEEFTVYKEIAVSQSPWIKAECSGEDELGELKVPGENSETFRCCLQWMYWKDVEVDYPAGKASTQHS